MTPISSETPTIGLGRFISETQFTVPNHQRDFSWTDENVNAFLHDVEEARQKRSDIYFCGLMVFTRSSTNLLKVLDGQQRLATAVMIFSAIRNWFAKYLAYQKEQFQVEAQLLQIDEIGSTGKQPRLELTAPNNGIFQQYVINAVPLAEIEKAIAAIRDKPSEDRNRTLLKAALLVNRYVETKAEEQKSTDAAHDYFLDLIKYIRDTVQVVRFVLTDEGRLYDFRDTQRQGTGSSCSRSCEELSVQSGREL